MNPMILFYALGRQLVGGCRRNVTGEQNAKLDVIDALDIEYAGDALDSAYDLFKLFAVVHIKSDFDTGTRIVLAAAFKCADIRIAFADYGRDIRQHSGTVAGENAQTDRE